jgi:hypothetical protein
VLREKIHQRREREIMKLIEAVKTLTELLAQSTFGRRTAIITRGYRLHGVTSFPIRRMKFQASRHVVSGNLRRHCEVEQGFNNQEATRCQSRSQFSRRHTAARR